MTGTLKTTCTQCGWPLSEKSPDCERHAPMPKVTKAEGLPEGSRFGVCNNTERISRPEGK